jgi:capsule polysaccharide export protein KpsE/RkpR
MCRFLPLLLALLPFHAYGTDPNRQQLAAELARAKFRLFEALQLHSEGSPEVKRAREEIEFLKVKLGGETVTQGQLQLQQLKARLQVERRHYAAQLAQAEIKLFELQQTRTEDNPEVKRVRAEIEFLKDKLGGRTVIQKQQQADRSQNADPKRQQVAAELAQSEFRLFKLRQTHSDDSPEVKRLRAKIEFLKEMLGTKDEVTIQSEQRSGSVVGFFTRIAEELGLALSCFLAGAVLILVLGSLLVVRGSKRKAIVDEGE